MIGHHFAISAPSQKAGPALLSCLDVVYTCHFAPAHDLLMQQGICCSDRLLLFGKGGEIGLLEICDDFRVGQRKP
jgi:hypothetical protein